MAMVGNRPVSAWLHQSIMSSAPKRLISYYSCTPLLMCWCVWYTTVTPCLSLKRYAGKQTHGTVVTQRTERCWKRKYILHAVAMCPKMVQMSNWAQYFVSRQISETCTNKCVVISRTMYVCAHLYGDVFSLLCLVSLREDYFQRLSRVTTCGRTYRPRKWLN